MEKPPSPSHLARLARFVRASLPGSRNRYHQGPPSDHFDGTVFFNPGGNPPGSVFRLIRWRLTHRPDPWPQRFESPFAPARPESSVKRDTLRVTMIGHATLLIQTAGLTILTDPVWSERVSPLSFVGPKRVNAPGMAIDDLPPLDIILVTHNHYDHMDLDTLQRLACLHQATLVTPPGNESILHPAVGAMRIETLDWGQRANLANGVRITAEPAHHWSARGLADRRHALWAAFVVETPAGAIYHVGDTGFHDGINYRAAGEKYGGFRLAVLPIGAYEPRWFMRHQHQTPPEAVEGMRLCRAAYAAGHHWGTFRLTDEAVSDPAESLTQTLKEAALSPERFRAMRPGESWDVPSVTAPDST